jgi:hypothetical protein
MMLSSGDPGTTLARPLLLQAMPIAWTLTRFMNAVAWLVMSRCPSWTPIPSDDV